ncbi:MAG: alpha/beta hydrolase [Candidatus Colwellbacteria bacterium]|nr:alpha/beta hydrolase [Candidatus Colwellbacteria bacterium]
MMSKTIIHKIPNEFGEKLDVLVEGNEGAPEMLVFVHGYGTDKDEGFSSFIDLSNAFKDEYLNIRYDQAGYGKSEGEDKAFNLQRAAGDLRSILRWAKEQYPDKRVNILAHSLGIFAPLLLSPEDVERFGFTSIPNADTEYSIDFLQKRIKAAGGRVDESGISAYPRSKGAVQFIGAEFWKTLRSLDPVKLISNLAKTSKIAIFRPMQDDVLGLDHFDEYKNIEGVQYTELDGDHNFTKLEDRKAAIDALREFLKK